MSATEQHANIILSFAAQISFRHIMNALRSILSGCNEENMGL
jgi:hypothetical protein